MLKRIIAILICIVTCASMLAFSGCKDKNDVEEDNNVVLMNGFEYFDRDVQLIRLFNEFGRLDQNSDPQYVKSGEKSLKLTPLGSRLNTANPYILLPSFSTRFPELAFGDFTSVDKLSFWFYNAEEDPVNVGIGFGKGVLQVDPNTRRDGIPKTGVVYFSLNNGWNYIEYSIDPSLLVLQGLNMKEVYGVIIEFDYVESHKLADSPEIYLDDVYITYTDTPKTTEFSMDVKTGVAENGNQYWMISDFENVSEASYFYYDYGFPSPAAAHPILKTVFAADYGVITKSGTQVMLIQKKHGGANYGWPTLVLNTTVIMEVLNTIGDDIKEHPENYELKFDVYNGSNYTGGWLVEYFPVFLNGAGERSSISTYDSVSVSPKTWHNHSWNIGDLDSRAKALKESDPNSGVQLFTENPYLRFTWERYDTEKDLADRQFFIDNVRIEKIA